jgi:hypothetical protein
MMDMEEKDEGGRMKDEGRGCRLITLNPTHDGYENADEFIHLVHEFANRRPITEFGFDQQFNP